jgi:hypothetical protein
VYLTQPDLPLGDLRGDRVSTDRMKDLGCKLGRNSLAVITTTRASYMCLRKLTALYLQVHIRTSMKDRHKTRCNGYDSNGVCTACTTSAQCSTTGHKFCDNNGNCRRRNKHTPPVPNPWQVSSSLRSGLRLACIVGYLICSSGRSGAANLVMRVRRAKHLSCSEFFLFKLALAASDRFLSRFSLRSPRVTSSFSLMTRGLFTVVTIC